MRIPTNIFSRKQMNSVATDPSSVARALHDELGLMLFDIAEILGVRPEQVAVWLSERKFVLISKGIDL